MIAPIFNTSIVLFLHVYKVFGIDEISIARFFVTFVNIFLEGMIAVERSQGGGAEGADRKSNPKLV